MKIVSLDFETSGFNHIKNEVLEIGAVAFFPRTGERRLFSVLVKNTKPIPKNAIKIHGIDAAFLEENGAIELREAMIQLVKFIKEDDKRVKLVGHNLKRFDLRFLKFNLTRVGIRIPRFISIHDTYIEERNRARSGRLRRVKGFSLVECCKRRGIKPTGDLHRALVDAELAMELYQKQWKQ